MKKIFYYLLSTLMISILTISCEKLDLEDENQAEKDGPFAVTLDASRYDFYAAKISGKVGGLEAVALDFECGIEYSTNSSFSKDSTWRINANVNYSDESYSVNVATLESGQKYYYRAYLINQLLIYYGEVKEFTFEWDVPTVTTLNAIEEVDTVILKGVINNLGLLVNYLDRNKIITFCGIEYSSNDSFDDSNVVVINPGSDNCIINGDTITCVLTTNIHSGNYFYRVFFKIGNSVCYGEKKCFRYGWDESLLIGSWSTSTWSYVFHDDHTGSRTQSGRTQTFTWSLDGDELELKFDKYEEGQSIVTFTVFIIEELNETRMEVYDDADSSKTIIVFTKKK